MGNVQYSHALTMIVEELAHPEPGTREWEAFQTARDALVSSSINRREALEKVRAQLNEGGDRNDRENNAFHLANTALVPAERADAERFERQRVFERQPRYEHDYPIERRRKVRLD